jgi:hypothetical protein
MVESVASLARTIARLERRAGMTIPREALPRLYIVAVQPVRDDAGKLLGRIERVVTRDGDLTEDPAVFVPENEAQL